MKVAQIIKRYDENAVSYDIERFNSNYSQVKSDVEIKKIKQILTKELGTLENKKILEVGIGTGRISIQLAKDGAIITGVDVSKNMLKVTKTRSEIEGVNISLINASGENLPFNSNMFDAVICFRVFAHVENHKQIYDEILRVIKADGVFIFDMYNADNSFIKNGEIECETNNKYVPQSISKSKAVGLFGLVYSIPTQYMLPLKLPYFIIHFLETLLSMVLPSKYARNIIYYTKKELNKK